MTIRQGDIYWIELGEPSGSEPGYRRPGVVIQNNLFNRSHIRTTIVCLITTNLRRGKAPGNVTMLPGEGGLLEESVVDVSQVFTVDKSDLKTLIGQLPDDRVAEVVAGLHSLTSPRDTNPL